MSFAFSPAAAGESRFVLVIQYPYDQKVKLPFYRTGALERIDGEAVVRLKKTTEIKLDMSDAPAPSSVKPEYQAYVLWAVDAKGRLTNLGAASKGMEIKTPLKAFGLVVSLEADPKAAAPAGLFVLESHFPEKKTSYFGMIKVFYTGKN